MVVPSRTAPCVETLFAASKYLRDESVPIARHTYTWRPFLRRILLMMVSFSRFILLLALTAR